MPLDNTHKTDHFKSSIQTQEKCHVLNGKKEKPGHIQRGHKKISTHLITVSKTS